MKTPAEIDQMLATAARIWDHAADNPPPFMTAAEEWAGHWGELRAEERAYEDEQLRARGEEARYGAA